MLFKIIKKFLKYIFAPILSLALLVGAYLYLYGNFHKVDNSVYRSAQLFSFNMPYYTEKYHIKSILNLRGTPDKQFYRDEINFSKENNITHYNYSISDGKVQTIKSMNKLINIIQNAPKPILIHCKAGADRTSLAAALYLYQKNHNEKIASKAISLKYLHFPWFGSRSKAMDESFELYVKKRDSYIQ